MFNSRGFTLIEVLISMVILAIGLLGLAAMQAISLRDNQDAYYYQQATLLAYEMQDRIKGNSDEWKQTLPAIPTDTKPTKTCNSSGNACTAPNMAIYDYWYWRDSVKTTLPPVTTGNIVEIKSSAGMNNAGCKGTYSSSLCLITRWARVNSGSSNKASKLSDTATFYLEVTP